MAVNGMFTIEDLYGGKSLNYHHPQLLHSALKTSFLSVDNELTTMAAELVLSTDLKAIVKQNKLSDVIPFTYFYWVLLVLAVILSLILISFFIYYCHTFVKNYRTHRYSNFILLPSNSKQFVIQKLEIRCQVIIVIDQYIDIHIQLIFIRKRNRHPH
mgnify:CR=1 FL=1